MRGIWTVTLAVLVRIFCADTLSAQPILTLIGHNVQVSSGLTLGAVLPSVAFNSVNDEYMVVWMGVGTTSNDVLGQRLSGSGGLVGENIPIANGPGSQGDPFITRNSTDNNYLVAWRSQFDVPGSLDFNDAFGRLVSNTGALLGIPFHISDGGLELSSAYNPTGNDYLVTGRAFASGPPGIVGQRISNLGSLEGNQFFVSTAIVAAPNGQVVYNPISNEYFATWRDQQSLNLKGQRISSTGALLGSPIVISPFFTGSGTTAASVAFDPTNDRYLVVFSLFNANTIWGQFVSSSGELIGPNFQIQSVGSIDEAPSIMHGSINNVFFIVWRDDADVFGQLLSETGVALGFPLVIAKGTAEDLGGPITVHNSNTGDAVVVWADLRNAPRGDIFAQVVGISTEQELDRMPPVISGMPSSCALWPPNNKLLQVAVVAATDVESGIAPGSFDVTGSSDEPSDAEDIVITPTEAGSVTVQLRAARLGKKKDRVYTLTATVADLAGNRATATASCVVPHDQRR
jgi:hypothetical protein